MGIHRDYQLRRMAMALNSMEDVRTLAMFVLGCLESLKEQNHEVQRRLREMDGRIEELKSELRKLEDATHG